MVQTTPIHRSLFFNALLQVLYSSYFLSLSLHPLIKSVAKDYGGEQWHVCHLKGTRICFQIPDDYQWQCSVHVCFDGVSWLIFSWCLFLWQVSVVHKSQDEVGWQAQGSVSEWPRWVFLCPKSLFTHTAPTELILEHDSSGSHYFQQTQLTLNLKDQCVLIFSIA